MLGTKLRNRYHILKELGVGGFGQTFLAKDCDFPGEPWCVVKQLKPQVKEPWMLQTARRLFDLEASVLARIGNHPQIPQLKAHFEEDQQFYLVQEFVEGDLLSKELKSDQVWTQDTAIKFLKDTLGVLKFIHDNQVIHRDLKPENIIRRKIDQKLVLIDFGSVKKITTLHEEQGEDSEFTVAIGTPAYMPVEQQGGKPAYNSDIYALGKIVIQGLSGIPPKRLADDPHTGELLWRHLVNVDDWFADILTGMVRWNGRDRYQNVDEIIDVLSYYCDEVPEQFAEKTVQSQPKRYTIDEVVHTLKQHSEITRIKKLLFCACKHRWENNPRVLVRYRTRYLVQEIYRREEDIRAFKSTLDAVVNTLNKKEKYQLVADLIVEQVQHLYESSGALISGDLENQDGTPSQFTAIKGAENYENELSVAQNYTEVRGNSTHQLAKELTSSVENTKISSSNSQGNLNHLEEEEEESVIVSNNRHCNIFDLRYEVTRYTTPLRIKILLFSALYYKIGFNEQDWSLMMSHQLDSLLKQIIQKFSTIAELENRLYATAKNFEEKEGLTQTVGAVLQSIRPFYQNGQPKMTQIIG